MMEGVSGEMGLKPKRVAANLDPLVKTNGNNYLKYYSSSQSTRFLAKKSPIKNCFELQKNITVF